jgi:twitching motility protein PilT
VNEQLAELKLSDLIHCARNRRASDLHLVPGIPATLRLDGRLEAAGESVLDRCETERLAASLFDDDEFRQLISGRDRSKAWRSKQFGTIRIHGYKSDAGVGIAFRLLHEAVPSLESLELPPVIGEFAGFSRGLVIFAGSTGSGKSTSLAALIERINTTSARRIVTIEDPIEYRHESKKSVITQREVGAHVRSFPDAVAGALRTDPDVIVVGEMREAATMRAVLAAAETGHLVLATLHTGDAVQTVDRIVDAFDGSDQEQVRRQISHVLAAVVCQRLVPRASGKGRRAVVEILIANDAVRNMIRESRTHLIRNAMLTGRDSGMQTLADHARELLAAKELNPDAVRALI